MYTTSSKTRGKVRRRRTQGFSCTRAATWVCGVFVRCKGIFENGWVFRVDDQRMNVATIGYFKNKPKELPVARSIHKCFEEFYWSPRAGVNLPRNKALVWYSVLEVFDSVLVLCERKFTKSHIHGESIFSADQILWMVLPFAKNL